MIAEHWTEYSRFLTALAVILDPFAALPIYLSLTRDYSIKERNKVALITALTVACVLLITALSGETILTTLGTSLASFRVGGGIVLIVMALAMLKGQSDTMKTTPSEAEEAASKSSVAVVPLGIPLLAGPGSISTVIIEMHRSSAPYHWIMVLSCIVLVAVFLWSVLRLANAIGRVLGNIGINIINRLFGLILTAIAIEIMANGLRELFPALG
jgi:multiple antibiotic resistance protein